VTGGATATNITLYNNILGVGKLMGQLILGLLFMMRLMIHLLMLVYGIPH